jgi:hypothetical protein
MSTVQHVSIFTKNPNLISGSEIGTIVKHYLKKDFHTYDDFKTVVTRKFALTSEQRKTFDAEKYKGMEFIFAKGNKFEAEVTEELTEKYSDAFDVINFNRFDKMILASDELGICAVPDILLKSDTNNILCEIKYAECGGKNTDTYKYQLIAQSLLVEGFYNVETITRLFFAIPNKLTGEDTITLPIEEKEALANDIKEAIRLLQADIKNGTLEFYTFEEMMKRFEGPETVEIEDDELLQVAMEIEGNKIQYQAYKAGEDKLKELCKERFGSKAINLLLTEASGMQYCVKHTCSKETYHTPESKREAILKAEKALEEAHAIEINSIRATSRFGVKVNLI